MKLNKKIPIILITITAAVLIFANLGNQYLWQDEAETALLARKTLEFGFPKAFDGKNIINPTIRTGYGPDHGWRYHPWGQFYITALSFKLLGESAFSARLPFAILGVINVILIYILTRYVTDNDFMANCSAALVTLSVPYLLLMRQCRYYAPALFFVLCISIFYLKYCREGRIKYLLLCSLALVGLGYTVHGMFIPVLAAIVLHSFFFAPRRHLPFKAAAVVIVFLAVLPWLLYSNSSAHTAVITLERIRKNFEFQLRMINKFIIPMFFFISIYAARLVFFRRARIDLTSGEKEALKYIGVVCGVSIAAFCFAQERNFRYLVYFIALLSILQSMILFRLANYNKYIMTVFLAISLTTGFFNMGYASCYLPQYFYEITHDYDGPIEGMVKFFRENAKPEDEIKIIYGDLPLMFYLDNKIDNSQSYDKGKTPRWIVFRHNWGKGLESDYYKAVRKKYKEHVLDYPDIQWENRPGDIVYHRFRTDKDAPRVIIFERDDQGTI